MKKNRKSVIITPKTEIKDIRSNNFNIVRFVAALMVFYGHMFAIMGMPVIGFFNQGVHSLGVKILFVISGYLITKSYLKKSDYINYIIKRFFRIIPGLVFLIFISIFVIGPVFTKLSIVDYFKHPGTWMYFKNLFMYPIFSLPGVFEGYIYPNVINGTLWSLPIEITLYLIFPFIISFFTKIKKMKSGMLIFTILLIILNAIHVEYFPTARLIIWGNNIPDWLSLVPYFFIGSCFFLYNNEEDNKIFNLQIATILLIIGSMISLKPFLSEIITSIVLPYFVLSFALSEKPFFCNWFKNFDLSYGIYLYGFPIQQIVFNKLIPYKLSSNIITFISIITVTIFAFISWHLIEKPTQKMCNKIINCIDIKKSKKNGYAKS